LDKIASYLQEIIITAPASEFWRVYSTFPFVRVHPEHFFSATAI